MCLLINIEHNILDDRKYRDIAIGWMEKIKSIDEFIESVTVEYMRAWIREITVYSEYDYIIFWIDDAQTEIGDCSRYEVRNTVKERLLNHHSEKSLINKAYKRYILSKSKKQIFPWKCNVAMKSSDVDKCKARYIRQEYIELNFMNLLLDIKNNHEFIVYLNKLLSDLELSSEELNTENVIETKMRNLNLELYKSVNPLMEKGELERKIDKTAT